MRVFSFTLTTAECSFQYIEIISHWKVSCAILYNNAFILLFITYTTITYRTQKKDKLPFFT